jgi:hypothetical protein
MNSQNYTNILVYFDDALLTQQNKVSVRRSTGSSPVPTTALGYGGESPGVGMTEIDVSNAVPSLEMEFDPGRQMKLLKRGKITLLAAGKTLSVMGQVYEDGMDGGVNEATGFSFKFRGPFSEWQ